MGKIKKHLCSLCGTDDPNNFRSGRKSKCLSCEYKVNNDYAQKHKDEKSEYDKKYRSDNKDRVNYNSREYGRSNRKRINEYWYNKRDKDPAFKFITNLRTRQGNVLKGQSSTTKGLGCSREELVNHLSSQFKEGMTLENHGEWHIDHIIPLSSHDKDLEGNWCVESEHNKKLIHYTNLQPLWAEDNLKKNDKLI